MTTVTAEGTTAGTNPDGAGGETVVLSTEGRISVITLNRPERLNAINLSTHLLLAKRLKEADRDPHTRVVVLTGAGRGFCSGGDVKDMVGRDSFGIEEGRKAVLSPGRDLVDTMVRMEKPLIAMVNGVAVGLGATIALLADVVMMADEASIGDRHVSVGLVAGDGGALIWPLLVGPSRAKEFLMTGRMIKGPEAERLGLVSRSVPLADLRGAVMELAEELAGLPPYAVQATKASVNRILAAVSGLVLDTSLAYEHLSMKMEDHQEALRARAEGRPGEYVGR
jgi:enoyl-CoA hydratase